VENTNIFEVAQITTAMKPNQDTFMISKYKEVMMIYQRIDKIRNTGMNLKHLK